MRKFARSILPGLLVLGLIIGAKPACAAAGSLDPTFGNGGVTVTSVAGTNGIGGKILVYVGGEAVLRYTITGALDPSFGRNGVAVLSTPVGGSLALQKNGQIVIGEWSPRAPVGLP